jgi:two-component system, NtrC family, sensor kinase
MKSTLCIAFIYFLSVLYSLEAYTQTHAIDSLKEVLERQKEDTNKVNILIQISEALPSENNTVAMNYATEALVLAQKLNFKRGEASSYKYISYFNVLQNNYIQARKNSFASLKIYERLSDKKEIAFVNTVIAKCYGIEENYPEALRYFYHSLKQWEELRDDNRVGETLGDIGLILYQQENYDECLKVITRSLKVFEKTGQKDGIARAYNFMAGIYLNLGNFEAALKLDSTVLKIYEEANNKADMFYVYQNIGNVTEKQGDLHNAIGKKESATSKYREALVNYNKALQSSQVSSDKTLVSDAYANLGNIHINLRNFSKARAYLEKSLHLQRSSKENAKKVYYNLSRLDSAEGNFKEAYEYYKNFVLYRDSLINEESTRKSIQSKLQYEYDIKEVAAKTQQAKKDAESKRIRNQQYFMIAALGIVVLAVVIISLIQYRNNKNKQKANALLHQQKEKVENTLKELKSTQAQLIQSEKMASLGELTAGIAHEIQNPLNFVNNFSEVNRELIAEMKTGLESGNMSELKSLLTDIEENERKINDHGKRAGSIVKGMLQHSQKSAGHKEGTDVNALADEYLRLSYHGFRAKEKTFNAAIETHFDESIGKINLVPQDIGRVLLNLFNNAFYAVHEQLKKLGSSNYQPTVSVSTKKLQNKIEIRVMDNGIGISKSVQEKIFQPFFTTKPTGQGTGLGLSLSYDIVKAHGGELNVESNEGEGAIFIVQLLT